MVNVSNHHFYLLILTLSNCLFTFVLGIHFKIKNFKSLLLYWCYFFLFYLGLLYNYQITHMSFFILLPLSLTLRKPLLTKNKFNTSSILSLFFFGLIFSSLKDQSLALFYFFLTSVLPPLYLLSSHKRLELEKERQLNERLLRKMIHDLGNPLSVIQGYVDMIKSGRIPPSKLEPTLDKIKDGCRLMQTRLSKENLEQTREAIKNTERHIESRLK